VIFAKNISFSVSALLQAIARLDLVPGLLLVSMMSILTDYSGYTIGQFKKGFLQALFVASAGELIEGPLNGDYGYLLSVNTDLYHGSLVLTFKLAIGCLDGKYHVFDGDCSR
jgi:hypothetical protein